MNRTTWFVYYSRIYGAQPSMMSQRQIERGTSVTWSSLHNAMQYKESLAVCTLQVGYFQTQHITFIATLTSRIAYLCEIYTIIRNIDNAYQMKPQFGEQYLVDFILKYIMQSY